MGAAFLIPAAIAAVSAGAQGINQMQANKRQQNAEGQAIANQAQFRENANSQVKNLTNQIAQNTPTQIAQQETGNFVNTLRKNAAGSAAPGATSSNPDTNFGAPVSALPPAAGANSRYKTDTANAQTEAQKFGNTNAAEMGAIDAAVRQRQNEGLALNTLGTNLNTIGAESYSKHFVDQLRAGAAGQVNPWVGMFSSILGRGAQAYAQNPDMFKSTPPPANWVGSGLPGDVGNSIYTPPS